METKTLEEEHEALLSDKGGETEYMQSLQHQIEKLKVKMVINIYLCYAETKWFRIHIIANKVAIG